MTRDKVTESGGIVGSPGMRPPQFPLHMPASSATLPSLFTGVQEVSGRRSNRVSLPAHSSVPAGWNSQRRDECRPWGFPGHVQSSVFRNLP